MSEKLPDISHIRGLGDPMFFEFNVEKKSNILISHAAIMGTFILPPDYKMNLCQMTDDPRLPHFVKFLVRNHIMWSAKGIAEIDTNIAGVKQHLRDLEKMIEEAKVKT